METIKRSWWKIIVIVLAGIVLDVVAHQLMPQLTSIAVSGASRDVVLPPSIIVQQGLFIPVFVVYAVTTFGLMAIIFVVIQERLPQEKLAKGILYGVSFGGLWFLGMLEGCLVLGSPLSEELFMGAADAIPIFLMCTLLGIFATTDTGSPAKRVSIGAMSIPVIAICYLLGRYLAYAILHIDSACPTKPFATFLWTLSMGLWVGLIYWLLERGVRGDTPLKRALWFGLLAYGTDWLLFTFFLPILFEMSLVDLFLRASVDVLFVTAGVFFLENKRQSGNVGLLQWRPTRKHTVD